MRVHIIDCRLQMGATDIFEIDINAFRECVADGSIQITTGLVVDGFIDACNFFKPFALVIGPGGTDYITAMRLCKLAYDRANSA